MGGDGEDRGNEIGHNLIIVETRRWVPEGPLSHSFLHVETFHKEVCGFFFLIWNRTPYAFWILSKEVFFL